MVDVLFENSFLVVALGYLLITMSKEAASCSYFIYQCIFNELLKPIDIIYLWLKIFKEDLLAQWLESFIALHTRVETSIYLYL